MDDRRCYGHTFQYIIISKFEVVYADAEQHSAGAMMAIMADAKAFLVFRSFFSLSLSCFSLVDKRCGYCAGVCGAWDDGEWQKKGSAIFFVKQNEKTEAKKRNYCMNAEKTETEILKKKRGNAELEQ